MRVVVVCPYSWSVPGGVSNHIQSLASHLRDRGHEVRIVAPADRPTREVLSVGRSVAVPYNGSIARIAFGPRVAARMRRALRVARPDVVHVHEPMAPSAGMLAVLTSRAPLVATFHAAIPQSRAYGVAAPFLRPLWNKIAVRIAVSEEARKTVERAFGAGVRIIPNGVTVELFRRIGGLPPEPRILFIGRLEPRKGAAVLVEAFRRVHAGFAGASLTIIGEGAQRRAIERAAEGMDVRFLGLLGHEELAAEIERAAVVCAPSLGGESFGIVLLEAMAAGRPVVASDIPGYAAVCRDGTEGVLVPPGDAEALAEALLSLLGDRERMERLGRAGRDRAARYSWDVVATQVEQAYRDAVARR